MSVRKSVKEISKPSDIIDKYSFFKSYENKLQLFFNKMIKLIILFIKKGTVTVLLIAVFGWFNIHNSKFIEGLGALAVFDPSGFSLIFDYESTASTIVEAWQVGTGTDYSWTKYKKEKGIDLHKKFTYIGLNKSLMKDVYTIGEATEDCASDICGTPAYGLEVNEANEYCEDTYGGRVLYKGESEKLLGTINPVIDPKINKRSEIPEWTLNVNPENGDDYFVYFKSMKKPEQFIEESYNKAGIYLDEDSSYAINIGFRCIVELPY